ncbi:MAG TPA: prolyl oligopeptidase family serine peptidase [Anaerolineales bacterium]|nr:prolyl oligopeptidase family serine peptidase [Anaerolineales bacterium]
MKPLDLRPEAIWRKRFRTADIFWAVTAHKNPQRGLVCTNKDGIYQLYAWDVSTDELTQVTDQSAGVIAGMISSDGNHIYFLRDEDGNEIGHFVRVPFASEGGGEAEDISPDLPPYSAFMTTQNRRGDITGFRTATTEGYKMYVKGEGQPPKLIHQSENISAGPELSYDGKIAVVASSDRTKSLDFSLLSLDIETGEPICELWEENASIENPIFSPLEGDARLVCTSSQPGFERPLIWNALSGEQFPLHLGEVPGAILPQAWSDDAGQILLCQIYQARYQLYRYVISTHTVVKLAHPVGTLGGFLPGFFAPDGEIWVTWEDSAHPSRLVALDEETGALKREVLKAGDAPEGKPFRSVTLVSENGDTIQGWLATPDGEGPWPTVFETHGGPTWVMSSLFSPGAQCWLDHGFAFFSLNYHGSTTFGKPFEKSIWGNLGDLEIQDMAAAYKWLVDNKIAQPDAVLLTGGSYGGYLTLQALGRRPELWAGGMAGIAIADWKTMYEDESESLRGYQRALFGGAPEEVPEATRKSSPITYAEQVQAPVLVIQGENDTRTPARQLRVYEEKLKSLGKQIEVHWFNAGHGSRAQEQQIEHQELMLNFAYRVLG